jgi:carbonic anhydrase
MAVPKNPFPWNHWPQQSPINLQKDKSLHVRFPKSILKFDYRGAPFTGKFVCKKGHENFVLTKPHPGKNPPTLKLGDVTAELVKIHLHTKSEHDLEGADLDGEIHLIHKINKPTDGSEFIVVGIFFDQSIDAAETELFSLWASTVGRRKSTKLKSESIDIDPRDILPDLSKWYRYEGSLTSEPYSEVVSWLVFVDAIGVDAADFKKLKKKAHRPEREIQPLNRRIVIRNFQ